MPNMMCPARQHQTLKLICAGLTDEGDGGLGLRVLSLLLGGRRPLDANLTLADSLRLGTLRFNIYSLKSVLK